MYQKLRSKILYQLHQNNFEKGWKQTPVVKFGDAQAKQGRAIFGLICLKFWIWPHCDKESVTGFWDHLQYVAKLTAIHQLQVLPQNKMKQHGPTPQIRIVCSDESEKNKLEIA